MSDRSMPRMPFSSSQPEIAIISLLGSSLLSHRAWDQCAFVSLLCPCRYLTFCRFLFSFLSSSINLYALSLKLYSNQLISTGFSFILFYLFLVLLSLIGKPEERILYFFKIYFHLYLILKAQLSSLHEIPLSHCKHCSIRVQQLEFNEGITWVY